jgi:hypothetical protein
MTTNWNKHSYICPTCDGSFEMTITEYRTISNELCPSCYNSLALLSVADATIHPTTTEEEQMETTTVDTSSQESMALHYNNYANIIVKDTTSNEMQYKSVTPYDVNVLMTDNHYYKQRLEKFTSKFNLIEENLTEEGWFNPNIEKSEVLSDLCEILGITPSKTIKFSGTMSFEGSIEVPFDELEDFDLQYLLQDEVYLTSNHGNLEIDSYEVESVSEDY